MEEFGFPPADRFNDHDGIDQDLDLVKTTRNTLVHHPKREKRMQIRHSIKLVYNLVSVSRHDEVELSDKFHR